MDITEIPYNKHLGVQLSSPQEKDSLLILPESEFLKNHVETIHASAQFSLAEACSGELLRQKFSHLQGNYLPLVRKTEVKYKKPAKGTLYGQASIEPLTEEELVGKLEQKGRAIVPIHVTITDINKVITMTAVIEWFIQRVEQI